MAKQIDNFTLLSTLYPQTPPTWDNRISTTDRAYWETAKILLSSSTFAPIRNEIFDALVNRIAITKIRKQSLENPLKQFRRGEMPFGDTLQEVSTDVIMGKPFTGEGDQFEKNKADVFAAYHRINRQSVYPTTVEDPRMKRAFVDEYGLQSLVHEIINQLYSSNEVDEYIYVKKLLNAYYHNDESPIQTTQIIEVPDLTDPTTTKADINEFLTKTKTVMRMMMFPSRKYTSSKIMTQSKPAGMTVFINVEQLVVNEISNLATVFNPSYQTLPVPLIGLDSIDDSGELLGVIVDNTAIDIYDTLNTTTMASNALGLYNNYFYHIHQLYAMSPFKPVIYLKKKVK